MTFLDFLYGALFVIVCLIGEWSRRQDKRIDDAESDLEKFKQLVYLHWEKDAITYVTKSDFNSLAKELKESLIRIENKIENLRGGGNRQ